MLGRFVTSSQTKAGVSRLAPVHAGRESRPAAAAPTSWLGKVGKRTRAEQPGLCGRDTAPRKRRRRNAPLRLAAAGRSPRL